MIANDYTFEEFSMHFRAMATVKDYTDVRLSYEGDKPTIHVGDDRNDVANTMRIMDYFAQVYHEPAFQKVGAFMGVSGWLAHHKVDFIAGGVARPSDEEGVFEVSDSLLRASFEAFKANEWNAVDVAPVVARAKILMGEKEAGG